MANPQTNQAAKSQFRSRVTTRRKMASLRVSGQRRQISINRPPQSVSVDRSLSQTAELQQMLPSFKCTGGVD